MSAYDKVCIDTFLEKQLQLFPEPVAESPAEADEFLDEVCALVFKDKKALFKMMKDELDVSGMSEEEMLSQDEVFALPDGRYLFVEG